MGWWLTGWPRPSCYAEHNGSHPAARHPSGFFNNTTFFSQQHFVHTFCVQVALTCEHLTVDPRSEEGMPPTGGALNAPPFDQEGAHQAAQSLPNVPPLWQTVPRPPEYTKQECSLARFALTFPFYQDIHPLKAQRCRTSRLKDAGGLAGGWASGWGWRPEQHYHALDESPNVDSNCVHVKSDSKALQRLIHGRLSRRQSLSGVVCSTHHPLM